MRKIIPIVALMLCTATSMFALTCPDKQASKAADYYLTNPYYAICTNLTATGNPDYPYKNADNENLKIADNDWIDYYWDGDCGVIYDNIYVSTTGNYNITWTYRSGGTGAAKVAVNGVEKGVYNTESTNWSNRTLVIADVALVAGQANTIKIWKHTNWPQNYSIQLTQQVQKSVVLLDHNNGSGKVDTVSAVKDAAMPAITAPTREDNYFVGYFDNAGTDEYNQYQYYAADASSFRKWDKTQDTVRLYAHWTNDDQYLSVRYKARLANWKENKIAGWDNTLIDFNGGGSVYFENIYVSKKGIYTVNVERNSGNPNCVMEVFVNGVQIADMALTDPSKWSSDIEATLVKGKNTIQFKQKTEWPVLKSIGLTLKKELSEQTALALMANDGTTTSVDVVATKDSVMPVTAVPVRPGYYFVGYFDNAGTDEYNQTQYYAADGSSYNVWNKNTEKDTLYAHWTYDDQYLTERYKARLANWKENKIAAWDNTLIDFNGGGSVYFENIYVSKKGIYTVNVERNSGSSNCVMEVFVNGVQIADMALTDPSKWSSEIEVKLMPGKNTIQFKQKTDWPVLKSIGLTLKSAYVDLRTGQTLEAYGTLCMPKNIIDIEGASVWTIVGKTDTTVEIEQVSGELLEGNPYIYQADSTIVSVAYGSKSASVAGTDNGLIGTFDTISVSGYYGIDDNNQLAKMAVGCRVPANRAYFDLSVITTKTPSPTAQRRTMAIKKDSPTALIESKTSTDTVRKVLMNGQILILKNNTSFNVLGTKL